MRFPSEGFLEKRKIDLVGLCSNKAIRGSFESLFSLDFKNLFTLSNEVLLPTVNMNNVPGVGVGVLYSIGGACCSLLAQFS
uniref:Uncharacterized protein n=1 Tax=Solanum lycopersicum TaxID=4081 RepID=A0A3Q7F9G3_SOLLC